MSFVSRRTSFLVLFSWTAVSLAVLTPTRVQAQDLISVSCRVFHDLDGDGLRDGGEPALVGVRVTNGREVHVTDGLGAVTLDVDRLEYRFATLTIPRGYWPTTAWYHWVPVGTAGPDTVDFGLETSASPTPRSSSSIPAISSTPDGTRLIGATT
jgi:hypothetical protein